ncbi:hypothetical protein LY78DRAFT_83130 [Colletotrichum sublineola]|nr:hypothetical protein LY78DRAFT_83130 [Colletotrichum sublineola]
MDPVKMHALNVLRTVRIPSPHSSQSNLSSACTDHHRRHSYSLSLSLSLASHQTVRLTRRRRVLLVYRSNRDPMCGATRLVPPPPLGCQRIFTASSPNFLFPIHRETWSRLYLC